MNDRAFSAAAFRRAWLDPSQRTDEIAERFGISPSTVRARAKAMGLPARVMGPRRAIPDQEAALRMHALGMSYQAIAEFFGCHWLTALNTLRRLGAPSRGAGVRSTMTAAEYRALVAAESEGRTFQPMSEAKRALLLELVRADVPRPEIARLVGCHISTVTKLARKAGLPPRRNGGHPRTSLAEFAQMKLGAAMSAEAAQAAEARRRLATAEEEARRRLATAEEEARRGEAS